MGFFDFLEPKVARPAPTLPVEGTITACDAVAGTILLRTGETLEFSTRDSHGFEPLVGLVVRVEATVPDGRDGHRAQRLRLMTEGARYHELLRRSLALEEQERRAVVERRLEAAAAETAATLTNASELRAEPGPGTRTVLTLRFETVSDATLLFRELTLDGRCVRVFSARAQLPTPALPEHVFERYSQRFETPDAARVRFEALVAAASRQYISVSRTVEALPLEEQAGLVRSSANVELERALEDATGPEAAQTARVLSDWYQSEGDARGELAALLLAGDETSALRFLEKNAAALMGELDVALHTEVCKLKWEHGFLRGVSLRRRPDSPTAPAALTAAFLALPFARFVTELDLILGIGEREEDWAGVLRAVAQSPRAPFLRKLSRLAVTDFSDAWAKLPSLEFVHVRSAHGVELGAIDAPKLTTFIREGNRLSDGELASLAGAWWPQLERLELWVGRDGWPGMDQLLEGLPASLRCLGLHACNFFQTGALSAVLESSLLPRLEVLDLSKGMLGDYELQLLLLAADQLRHLRRLDVTQNMTNAYAGRLKEVLPNVVVDQHLGPYFWEM